MCVCGQVDCKQKRDEHGRTGEARHSAKVRNARYKAAMVMLALSSCHEVEAFPDGHPCQHDLGRWKDDQNSCGFGAKAPLTLQVSNIQ